MGLYITLVIIFSAILIFLFSLVLKGFKPKKNANDKNKKKPRLK